MADFLTGVIMLFNKNIFFCAFSHFVCTLTLFGFASTRSFSQERCGIIQYQENLEMANPDRENDSGFERWLAAKVEQRAGRLSLAETTISIPVVVHIIHRGEATGTGANLSDAQVLSQIRVLNEDFNRGNVDTVNTPQEFRSLAGKFRVEFVLASQTPDSLPTTGILRKKGSKNIWTVNDNSLLKSTSYWPAEDYLNLWVTDLSESLLGYAQFPVSAIQGLEGAETNRLTDGVVIDYRAFGSTVDGNFDLYPEFSRGRAATHEIGHFFGLRHIWGDDNGLCGGSGDYVSDTPDQANNTSGCPSHPYSTCNVTAMFQNYMDYTNDNCMNIFTVGQITRMKTVLENSVRRKTLSTSHGLIDPQPQPNDLALSEILSPGSAECNNSVVPRLKIKNVGSNEVTSARLRFTVDGRVNEVKTFDFNPALLQGQIVEVSFGPANLPSGTHEISFEILLTSNGVDSKLSDNKKNITTFLSPDSILPLRENLETLPTDWIIVNPDQKTTWAIDAAPNLASSNQAMSLGFYNYENAADATDWLITPKIDLTAAQTPYLSFDVAYARYPNRDDGLKVYVRTDCQPVDEATLVYSKYGSTLATTENSSRDFVPSGEAQWRKEFVDLTGFSGATQVQFIFEGINDHGNNLYIDNIRIARNLADNIAVTEITRPQAVQCYETIFPTVTIKNRGEIPVTHFRIRYAVDDGEVKSQVFTDTLHLLPGASIDVTLPSITLPEGKSSFFIQATDPNDLKDSDPSDNSMTVSTIRNSASEVLPLRQNFDAAAWTDKWIAASRFEGMNWMESTTNFNQSLNFNARDNVHSGEEAWLVSPLLDLSNVPKSSMHFDLSYRHRDNKNDQLRILASRNCGATFDEVLYDKSGRSLTDIADAGSWLPTEGTHWKKEYIDLAPLLGEEQTRLAFVFTNRNGNNVYLDNIEFFLSNDPSPVSTEDLYAVYGNNSESPDEFYITFSLKSHQAVNYKLIDITGKELTSGDLDNVLNQTYRIACTDFKSGMYIVRLMIGNKFYSEKIYLSKR
jgi:hypothetical protein